MYTHIISNQTYIYNIIPTAWAKSYKQRIYSFMVHVVGFKIRLELASNTFISAELACNFPFFFSFFVYLIGCTVAYMNVHMHCTRINHNVHTYSSIYLKSCVSVLQKVEKALFYSV